MNGLEDPATAASGRAGSRRPLGNFMRQFDQENTSTGPSTMGLSEGRLARLAALQGGRDPRNAALGISTSGSNSPNRGFTPSPMMGSRRFDRLEAADAALDARRESQPKARNAVSPLTGKTSVVAGSAFGPAIRAGLPGAMEDFREFNRYREEATAENDGQMPQIDAMPQQAQNIYDRYRSGQWEQHGAYHEPFIPGGQGGQVAGAGADVAADDGANAPAAPRGIAATGRLPANQRFAAAKAAREERQQLARQRRFALNRLPVHQRQFGQFEEDGSLDQMGTNINLARAGRLMPGAMLATGQQAQAQQAEQRGALEFLQEQGRQQVAKDQMAIEQQQLEASMDPDLQRRLALAGQGIDPDETGGPLREAFQGLQQSQQVDPAQRESMMAVAGSRISQIPDDERQEVLDQLGLTPAEVLARLEDLASSQTLMGSQSPAEAQARQKEFEAVKRLAQAYGLDTSPFRMQGSLFDENAGWMSRAAGPTPVGGAIGAVQGLRSLFRPSDD